MLNKPPPLAATFKANDRWPIINSPSDVIDISGDIAMDSQSVSSSNSFSRTRKPCQSPLNGHGRWTKAEHARFMRAVALYPSGPWKHIGAVVITRSIRQIQTHAQKLREKAARHDRGLKIKTNHQSGVALPSYFLERGRSVNDKALGDTHNATDHTTDARGLPLDECLDFFLQIMDDVVVV
ncbi:hypothetical protein DYB34_009042 [Aphanomyces astaci]|uniref:HTH myb-type domain-containing protein n=1 Tax=Aphanomyces astaci TaxID=112090 RepID=A0A3R6W0Q4_APHAT|nr:hypothetical protein DYB34_009042 [Aphanomyces astaci]